MDGIYNPKWYTRYINQYYILTIDAPDEMYLESNKDL